jgi:hypothetical protein
MHWNLLFMCAAIQLYVISYVTDYLRWPPWCNENKISLQIVNVLLKMLHVYLFIYLCFYYYVFHTNLYRSIYTMKKAIQEHRILAFFNVIY